MKTAYESRQQVYDNFIDLSKELKDGFYSKVIQLIEESIESSVEKGEFRCFIDFYEVCKIHGDGFSASKEQKDFEVWLKDMLESYGYELEFCQIGESGYIIKWVN